MTDDKKRRQRRCPVQEYSMYFGSLKEAVCCTSYKDIFPFLCFVCRSFFVIFASLPLLCGSSLIVVISLQIKRFFSNVVTFPVADRDTEAENQKQAFKLFFRWAFWDRTFSGKDSVFEVNTARCMNNNVLFAVLIIKWF